MTEVLTERAPDWVATSFLEIGLSKASRKMRGLFEWMRLSRLQGPETSKRNLAVAEPLFNAIDCSPLTDACNSFKPGCVSSFECLSVLAVWEEC